MTYQMHPVEIPFVDLNGKKQTYRPLVMLSSLNGNGGPKNRKNVLADIYSDEDIRANAVWLIPAWKAAHQFAHYKRMKFRIFRDKFFLSDYFYNIKLIKDYRWLIPSEQAWRFTDRFLKDQQNRPTVQQLILIGTKDSSDRYRNKFISSIWTLLAMGCIHADWNKRFNQDTILWV